MASSKKATLRIGGTALGFRSQFYLKEEPLKAHCPQRRAPPNIDACANRNVTSRRIDTALVAGIEAPCIYHCAVLCLIT